MKHHTSILALMSALVAAGQAHAQTECRALAGLDLPSKAIGLPSNGALIDTADVVAAEGDFAPYCKVTGHVKPADVSAPSILFQINLPAEWNGKAVQMGGAGLNGVVVDGLGNLPGTAGPNAPLPPLARGYVTFGSDSGHQAANGADATFGTNKEALANYGGAAVKRLHDAALPVIEAHYGVRPSRMYHVGGSKGGHEGLIAAQRYGSDYDGVISYYPAKDTSGLILGWQNMLLKTYGTVGAAISPAKQQMIKEAALAACDALDGLEDGVIANTQACRASFSARDLACEAGANDGASCLTPPQVDAIASADDRYTLPFALAHGVTTVGPWPALIGGDNSGLWLDKDGTGASTPIQVFVNGVVRYFWTDDTVTSLYDFDPEAHKQAIEDYAALADANATDLSQFTARKGKLILVQGTTDMLVPPSATADWYVKAAAALGGDADETLRYYVQPGYGHGFGAFKMGWDSLTALDTWVETGAAPAAPVAVDGNEGANRAMPLCAYPAFPRYQGGDTTQADSFVCALK